MLLKLPFVPEILLAVMSEAFNVATVPLVKAMVVPVTEPPTRELTVRVEIFPLVAVRFEAKRFVDVVLVPVAFVQDTFVNVEGADPVTVKFTIVPLVAKRFVVVADVEVTLVKTPVLGVTLPICVPLIDPPEIVALFEVKFGAFKLITVPVNAFTVVPEAVAKPNQPVDVPFVNVRFVAVPLVVTILLTNKLVPVALVNKVSCRLVTPETSRFPLID